MYTKVVFNFSEKGIVQFFFVGLQELSYVKSKLVEVQRENINSNYVAGRQTDNYHVVH